jgi:oligopeptidase A
MNGNIFPNWATFTPEKAAADLPRLLSQAEAGVAALEQSRPATYESLVDVLDDATRELYHTWGMVGHMTSVMNSDAWRQVEEGFQPQLVAFSLRVGQSQPLYRATKALLAARQATPPSDESPAQCATRNRILQKSVEAAEHAGVGLSGAAKDRFNEIQAKLAKLGMDFSNAVLDATKAFKFEKDGKTYTIDDANYPETMKHCADREVRERLCRARATRAPENAARIDEILALRAELAKILGYDSYAELSLSAKCAPSVAAALKMIDDLDAATVKRAKEEEEELCASVECIGESAKVASSQPHSHSSPSAHPASASAIASAASPLKPWDVSFCAERLREKKYAYSEEELKKHFELEDVLKGLFKITNLLFDVTVTEVTGADKPSVWHPDVRFFAVQEKGETIAHFYFDPFVRNGQKSGGAWMNEFRNRSRRLRGQRTVNSEQRTDADVLLGSAAQQEKECLSNHNCSLFTVHSSLFETPLALVCTNFPAPDADGHCYLPFREVETLFHEFGHALQCMLTRIDEEDAAGINLVEWDAVEVASQFMENWCLDDRTGIAVPKDLKAKVRAAKNFRAACACRRQLAFAKTDLLLHGVEKVASPNELKNAMFAHFGLKSVPGDQFLSAFTHIFAGGYAAGYYGYKWAEVMSADCYGAFEEAGLASDAAVRRVGAKYRETVLALGGSKSAIDVFRAFRGRDPEIAALLRQTQVC